MPTDSDVGFESYYDVYAGGGGGGCFLPGSLVTMADGTTKPIEQIAVGDELASYDVPGLGWNDVTRETIGWKQFSGDGIAATFMSRPTVVHAVLQRTFHAHFVINGEVKATYEHPFLAMRLPTGQAGNGACQFIRCSGLRVGDLLFKNGTWAAVATIERVVGGIETWNLDVGPLELFLVDGYLVHNTTQKN